MSASVSKSGGLKLETHFESALSGRREEDRVVALTRPWPGKLHNASLSEPNLDKDDSARELFASSAEPYQLFCVFDGHRGAAASRFCAHSIVGILEPLLPPRKWGPLAVEKTGELGEWEGELQAALLRTVVELQAQFAGKGSKGGCTAVIVLQVGRLVTCASSGSSRAVLYTQGPTGFNTSENEGLELSADHRVGSNENERRRLTQRGVQLATLDVGGSGPAPEPSSGCGCLRIWPGGLAISRVIGDFAAGEALLPLPHLKQVLLPLGATARIVLATESVWREGAPFSAAVREALRDAPLPMCPHQVVGIISKEYGMQDDASLVVVDVSPVGARSLSCGRRGRPGAVKQGCFLFRIFKGNKGISTGSSSRRCPTCTPVPRLLSDVDSAQLMGLTSDPPPETPPLWFTLRLMSELHKYLKQARMSWQAARRTKLAGGTADSNGVHENRSSLVRRNGSRRSLSRASSRDSLAASPSRQGHEASRESLLGSAERAERESKKERGWLAAYDSRASHFMRGTASAPVMKRGAEEERGRPRWREEPALGGAGYSILETSSMSSPSRSGNSMHIVGSQGSLLDTSLPKPPRRLLHTSSASGRMVEDSTTPPHPSSRRASLAGSPSSDAGARETTVELSTQSLPMRSPRGGFGGKPPLSPIAYPPGDSSPPFPPQRSSGDGYPPLAPRTPHLGIQRSASAAGMLEGVLTASGSSGGGGVNMISRSRSPLLADRATIHAPSGRGVLEAYRRVPHSSACLPVNELTEAARKLPQRVPCSKQLRRTQSLGSNQSVVSGSEAASGDERDGKQVHPAEEPAEVVAAASAALQLFYRNAEKKGRGKAGSIATSDVGGSSAEEGVGGLGPAQLQHGEEGPSGTDDCVGGTRPAKQALKEVSVGVTAGGRFGRSASFNR